MPNSAKQPSIGRTLAPLICAAVAFAIAGLAAGARAANIEQGTIRGAIGVAGVELGMTADEVTRKLGPPVDQNMAPGGRVVFMSYHATENFGVYFDEATARVRMIIVAVRSGKICTRYGACLYREGDLAKIKAHYGPKLLRFVDRDGSATYRRLAPIGERKVMTEFTPVEEKNGVVQVAILYWTGKIDTSSFD